MKSLEDWQVWLLFLFLVLSAFLVQDYFASKDKQKTLTACIQAGHSPQECTDALYSRVTMNFSIKDKPKDEENGSR